MMKKNILLLLFFGLCFTYWGGSQSLERSTLSSAGTFYNISGTQLSWSAAQPGLVETFSNSSATLTQGFHQQDFFSSITEIVPDLFTIKVYPNPSTGDFFFDLSAMNEGKIDLQLFDASGRVIFSQGSFSTINSLWNHRINLGYLPVGIYHCRFLFQSQTGGHRIKNLKLTVIK